MGIPTAIDIMEKRIPITVIGGFLGSGKTTLVNRIIGRLTGVRATVLVNDFGAINIDADLIAAAGGDTVSLTNGCICCSIGGELTDALIRVIGMSPAPDWILIEASGVSDPWKIAEVGLADPALLLDGVIVLVDAASILEFAADPYLSDTVLRQLLAADILVINKTDLVGQETLGSVRAQLKDRAPQAWIHETTKSDVPLELLSSRFMVPGQAVAHRPSRGRGPAHRDREVVADHAHIFSTRSFETTGVFSEAKLRALLHDMPADIIRAKGIVRTDRAPTQATVMQFAGRSRMLRVCGPWEEGPSQIVLISPSPLSTRAFAEAEVRLAEAVASGA